MTGVNKHSEELKGWAATGLVWVGVDLGDRQANWAAVDGAGEFREGKVAVSDEGLRELFGDAPHCRVVLEAGTHTPWVARALKGLGHEAVVVDARILATHRRRRKNDRGDARRLMEVGREMDYKRVPQVWQRPEANQEELTLVRMRDALVRSRGLLVNSLRGAVKPHGERLGSHSSASLARFGRVALSPRMQALGEPAFCAVEALNQQLRRYDERVAEQLARRQESERLLQVHGVGPVTVAVFMAVVGDPRRFRRSRDVAAYLGLAPLQQQSGEHDPQLGISKAGNGLARRVLVQCAHYILGLNGQDSALRRWGLAMAGDGKNQARKRKAVIAVARKLAVLLLRLWVSGERYEPLRGVPVEEGAVA